MVSPHFYVGLLTVGIQYTHVSTINPSYVTHYVTHGVMTPLGCLIRGRTISVDFSREKHCSSKKTVQNGSFPPVAWRVILGLRQVMPWMPWCRRLEDLTQQFKNCYVITSGLTFFWHHRDSPWDHHGKPPSRSTVRSRCPPFEAHGVRDVDPRQAEGATKAHEASIPDADRTGGIQAYHVVHLMMGIWDMDRYGMTMGIY